MLHTGIGNSSGTVAGWGSAWFIWIKVTQQNKRDSNSHLCCFVFFLFSNLFWLILMHFKTISFWWRTLCIYCVYILVFSIHQATFMEPFMFDAGIYVCLVRSGSGLVVSSSFHQKNKQYVHCPLGKFTLNGYLPYFVSAENIYFFGGKISS